MYKFEIQNSDEWEEGFNYNQYGIKEIKVNGVRKYYVPITKDKMKKDDTYILYNKVNEQEFEEDCIVKAEVNNHGEIIIKKNI